MRLIIANKNKTYPTQALVQIPSSIRLSNLNTTWSPWTPDHRDGSLGLQRMRPYPVICHAICLCSRLDRDGPKNEAHVLLVASLITPGMFLPTWD